LINIDIFSNGRVAIAPAPYASCETANSKPWLSMTIGGEL